MHILYLKTEFYHHHHHTHPLSQCIIKVMFLMRIGKARLKYKMYLGLRSVKYAEDVPEGSIFRIGAIR